QRRPKRRFAAYAVLALFLITAAAVAGTAFFMKSAQKQKLSTLITDADTELRSKQYRRAAEKYGDLTTKDTTNAAKYRFFREYAQQMDAATDTTKETDSRLKDFSRWVFDTQGSAEAERLKEFSADIRDAFAKIAEDQVKGATTKADAQDFVNAKTAQDKALET